MMKFKNMMIAAAVAAAAAAFSMAAYADQTFTNGGMTLQIPDKYADQVVVETPADDPDGMLFSVSEKASIEAAKTLGYNTDGAGWLFGIERVSEEEMRDLRCADMSGMEIFARDTKNNDYYLLCHPTDVRYFREDNDRMAEDQEKWTELVEWAMQEAPQKFVEENAGLSEETHTNTELDIVLAHIAFRNDLKYTISTTQYGPLEPKDVDPENFVFRLMDGVTYQYKEVEEAPDGEYVVLNIPDQEVRFDFFTGDKDLVRMVTGVDGDEYASYFEASFEQEEDKTAADIMNEWYDALAKANGK